MKTKTFDTKAQAVKYFYKLANDKNINFCSKYYDAQTARWTCMWSYQTKSAAAAN